MRLRRICIFGSFALAFLVFLGNCYIKQVQSYPITDVTVVGNINYADGIGRQTIDLLEMLNEKDISSNFIPSGKIISTDLSNYVLKKIHHDNTDKSIGHVMIYERVLKASKNEIPIKFFFNSFLSWLKDFPREKQIWIAYSLIESTSIPSIWTEKINKYFDAVAVPDEFLVDVYKNSGVTKPIFVVPLSIDLQHMLDLELKKERNDPFIFMNLTAISARKNQLKLIEAFHKTFNNDPKVKLVLNGRVIRKNAFNDIKKYVKNNKITNIEISNKSLTKQEYLDLLTTADCYVNISKGEGFSVTPREAMALGIPVIISNNTSQKTIAKSNLALAIDSDIKTPSYNEFLKLELGEDFDTDIKKISSALTQMYNNYGSYLKNSSKMRDWTRQYHHDNVKFLYHNLIKPKKIILGNKNKVTKEYLETDSKELYEKYISERSN